MNTKMTIGQRMKKWFENIEATAMMIEWALEDNAMADESKELLDALLALAND